jgi:predicted SprT family Zn-dependent metalloprotease
MRRVATALEVLLRPFRGLVLRAAANIYRAGKVSDLHVVDLSGGAVRAEVLQDRLAAALRTIERHDRRRATRLKTDLKRFLITDAEGAEFIPSIRACALSSRYVARASADELAATIVHEATHARLWARGIRYSRSRRERIERLCTREEIDFARHLESAENLVADAEARLQREWWTEEHELERRLRQLEQLGRPMWYRRMYRWIWTPRRPTTQL